MSYGGSCKISTTNNAILVIDCIYIHIDYNVKLPNRGNDTKNFWKHTMVYYICLS